MFSRNVLSTKVMSTCQQSLHLSFQQVLNPPTLMFGQKMAVKQYSRSSLLNVQTAIQCHLASVRCDIDIIHQPNSVIVNKILDGVLKQKNGLAMKQLLFINRQFLVMTGSESWSDKENKLHKGIFITGFYTDVTVSIMVSI